MTDANYHAGNIDGCVKQIIFQNAVARHGAADTWIGCDVPLMR
jgi:hypothetical protein